MKLKIYVAALLGLALLQTPADAQDVPKKPYKTVLVLVGTSMHWPHYVGTLQGVIDHYGRPDLVIGTGGASAVAWLANQIADDRKRQHAVASAAHFEGLKKSYRCHFSTPLKMGLEMLSRTGFAPGTVPPIFEDCPYTLEQDVGLNQVEGLDPAQPFSAKKGSIRGLTIGLKLDYTPKDVGEKLPDAPFQHEVIFTDPETADAIQSLGLKPRHAPLTPWLAPEYTFNTTTGAGVAARIAFTDAFLFNPIRTPDTEDKKGTYYLGSIVDPLPIELARSLGETVIAVYHERVPTIADGTMEKTFGFSLISSFMNVPLASADYWINEADLPEKLSQISLMPSAVPMDNIEEGLVTINPLPSDATEFSGRIRKMMQYGYKRAKQAFVLEDGSRRPRGDTRHILK